MQSDRSGAGAELQSVELFAHQEEQLSELNG